ncbi:hypothetical protein AO718_20395 [Aeromonas veronii]|nr:hypothetical protein AO728_08520 [Aeromonas veronii]KRV71187.1 hypothetical protein AO719_10175 [Aeromonas veronii]KRV80608.1 hypothetical protein AO718_20395 [Aeromonas veronii]KRV82235.1 hypothetical protein AO739_12075 [Aeromonas veronii]KRV82560.1 hypothetical protein AO721_11870 [Aeromonas veronii]
MNGLNLLPIKTLLAVHLRGKRDRIRHQIGLTRCGKQFQLSTVYFIHTAKNTIMLEDMMTNSVSNVVKSSKLGAVTQCGSHDHFDLVFKKQPFWLLLLGKVVDYFVRCID